MNHIYTITQEQCDSVQRMYYEYMAMREVVDNIAVTDQGNDTLDYFMGQYRQAYAAYNIALDTLAGCYYKGGRYDHARVSFIDHTLTLEVYDA